MGCQLRITTPHREPPDIFDDRVLEAFDWGLRPWMAPLLVTDISYDGPTWDDNHEWIIWLGSDDGFVNELLTQYGQADGPDMQRIGGEIHRHLRLSRMRPIR